MILMYHKVDIITPTMWWVSVDAFDRQMADLQAYEVVHLSEYDQSNPKHVCITFDGVYENVYRFAYPILKKWGYPFELFVIGGHVGGDNAFDVVEPLTSFCAIDQLAEMAGGGARIQWHTHSHRRLLDTSNEILDEELTVPEALRIRFASPHFDWFAYPHGDHDERAVERVKALYKGALSCVAGSDDDRYQLNRITAEENTDLSRSRVSLIIANYNYGAFLPEAVESVLAQTRKPDEFIILDDCSTDGSQTVAQRYAGVATVILNEENLGIVENFRKGVSLASGDYIVFLGADNRMRPDYIERCKAILDADMDVGVVYTDMLVFGARASALAEQVGANQIGESRVERWPIFYWQFPDPTPEAVASLATRNFIHGSSMYRRKAYDDAGGYQESELPEDHHLFQRMVSLGWKPIRSPHALIQYRQHSYNQANTVLGLQYESAYWRDVSRRHQEQAAELAADIHRLHDDLRKTKEQQQRWAEEFERLVNRAGLVHAVLASGFFEPSGYAASQGIPSDDEDFLVRHYMIVGESKGAAPSGRFDPTFYAERYPEVSKASIGMLEHFVRFGRFEGRLAKAPESMPETRSASDVSPIVDEENAQTLLLSREDDAAVVDHGKSVRMTDGRVDPGAGEMQVGPQEERPGRPADEEQNAPPEVSG